MSTGYQTETELLSSNVIQALIETAHESYLTCRLEVIGRETVVDTDASKETKEKRTKALESYKLLIGDNLNKINWLLSLKREAYDVAGEVGDDVTGDGDAIKLKHAATALVRAQQTYLNALSFLDSYKTLVSRNNQKVKIEAENIKNLNGQKESAELMIKSEAAKIEFLRSILPEDMEIIVE